jgi:hypothetical protein
MELLSFGKKNPYHYFTEYISKDTESSFFFMCLMKDINLKEAFLVLDVLIPDFLYKILAIEP